MHFRQVKQTVIEWLLLQLRKKFFAFNRNLSCAGMEYIVFSMTPQRHISKLSASLRNF